MSLTGFQKRRREAAAAQEVPKKGIEIPKEEVDAEPVRTKKKSKKKAK